MIALHLSLQVFYVGDGTKTSVNYETQISTLKDNVTSIERRKH